MDIILHSDETDGIQFFPISDLQGDITSLGALDRAVSMSGYSVPLEVKESPFKAILYIFIIQWRTYLGGI